MTNRAAYEAGLWRPDSAGQRRGDRCLAGAAWWTIPSGQARNSAVAIEVMLIGRLLFHQPRRQTQGLLGSLLEIMGFDLPVLVFFRHSALKSRVTAKAGAGCMQNVAYVLHTPFFTHSIKHAGAQSC